MVATEEILCYHTLSHYSCARSEVGLSRLPVTEEIAGSNPVGRAKINHSPSGWVIYFDASGGFEPAIGALAP